MNLVLRENGFENVAAQPITEKEKAAILESVERRYKPRFPELPKESVPCFQCHNCFREVSRGTAYCEICADAAVSKKSYKELETPELTRWEIAGAAVVVGLALAAIFGVRWLLQNGYIG